MYAELKQIIARKSESPPASLVNVPPATLDAVQLTSILSASGFHLDHFDIDRSRRNAVTVPPTGNVLVEITCQRSGIVSRMHLAPAACTCPTEDECARRSAIWDVQAAGGNAAVSADACAVSSSSNLLPQLSPRKVQITKHLLKVMLDVFEAPDDSGKGCTSKSQLAVTNGEHNNNGNRNGPITPDHGADANGHTDPFRTPVSSINVTPMRPEDFVAEVVGMPKVLLNRSGPANGAATGEQAPQTLGVTNLSTASFTSPGSDMFTSSSPNTTPGQIRALPVHERDQVVSSLRQIRQNIDQTLSLLDFDSTRNITTATVDDESLAGSCASAGAATATAARRAALPKVGARTPLLVPPAQSTGRRHSLSVVPGTTGATTGIQRRLQSIAAGTVAARASFGTSSFRRPAEGASPSAVAAERRKSLQAVSRTTTTTTVHVSTPRPQLVRAVTPRVSLVARNSTAAGTRNLSRLPGAGPKTTTAAAAAGGSSGPSSTTSSSSVASAASAKQ